jgi:hypothetical protein
MVRLRLVRERDWGRARDDNRTMVETIGSATAFEKEDAFVMVATPSTMM